MDRDAQHATSEPPRALRVAIIGAGMAGILSAIKLKEAGLTDFTVYEKADRVGGTWRENTYPGLSCDVPSHLYSYSFALTPEWSHRYSPGAEIQAYFERTRGRAGVRLVGLREARRELLAALRRGVPVGLVGDRDLTGGGTPIDLFGAPNRKSVV